MKLVRLSIFVALCVALLASCKTVPQAEPSSGPAAASGALPISWLELAPNATLVARTITAAATCPSIAIDGQLQPMNAREVPSPAFPALVCEAPVPSSAKSAKIDADQLPVPTGKLEHAFVIGSTGCRAKVSHGFPIVQDCLDPVAWPFGNIASALSVQRPDLIIHVGDYLFRELEVPGQPFGDRLETWLADFLLPARPLLKTAPWIFVRDSHETCGRGGEGWRRLIDPRPMTSECVPIEDSYWTRFGGLDLAVLDTAAAADEKPDEQRVKEFDRQIGRLDHFPIKDAWLVTGRPLWDPIHPDGELNRATKGKSFRKFVGIAAGHAHYFGAVLFEALPAEFVSGNGGSTLSPLPTSAFDEVSIGGRRIQHAIFQQQFGYLELEHKGKSPWRATERDVLGAPQLVCELKPSAVCNIPRGRGAASLGGSGVE